MSFIYCAEDYRKNRWYYHETPGFREHVPGSSSSFSPERAGSYEFSTKAEAWEHCRSRRPRNRGHWSPRTKWIVITLRAASAQTPEKP